MNDIELTENLKKDLGDKALELVNPTKRRIFLGVDQSGLTAAVTLLREKYGFWHLATISGVDSGEVFELLYHFGDKETTVNVRVRIPKSDPRIPSITPVIPGAVLYERELQDMFGIRVENIPDPRPMLTPDNWPAGQFPLRKDWKFERPVDVIPGGKS